MHVILFTFRQKKKFKHIKKKKQRQTIIKIKKAKTKTTNKSISTCFGQRIEMFQSYFAMFGPWDFNTSKTRQQSDTLIFIAFRWFPAKKRRLHHETGRWDDLTYKNIGVFNIVFNLLYKDIWFLNTIYYLPYIRIR